MEGLTLAQRLERLPLPVRLNRLTLARRLERLPLPVRLNRLTLAQRLERLPLPVRLNWLIRMRRLWVHAVIVSNPSRSSKPGNPTVPRMDDTHTVGSPSVDVDEDAAGGMARFHRQVGGGDLIEGVPRADPHVQVAAGSGGGEVAGCLGLGLRREVVTAE